MTCHRRHFLELAAGSVLAGVLPFQSLAAETRQPRFKALVFDAFPIFDPRPIGALAESLFPGQGEALMNVWRTRQFEYQWLRALGGQYIDFLQATDDGLTFAAGQLRLTVSSAQRAQLMAAWTNLQPWPDVASAIGQLRQAGVRLAFLSNMTAGALSDGLRAARLDGTFEAVISTERVRSYKPDPRAYQLGIDTLGLRKEEILFVAFAGWDVAGAKWFGYPTFWVNRTNAPAEQLGATADATGADLAALLRFVLPG
ncbi:MAG TPA: haloacid dehalogenase type II [Gemmatimonas sp.]|uniref:haloacid dehalogenase type II n=1 Tax=Gemmatimonas sp. TaxID=1962908 RepID=UPI002EDB0940